MQDNETKTPEETVLESIDRRLKAQNMMMMMMSALASFDKVEVAMGPPDGSAVLLCWKCAGKRKIKGEPCDECSGRGYTWDEDDDEDASE